MIRKGQGREGQALWMPQVNAGFASTVVFSFIIASVIGV